jgi:hypothetical protein
MMIGVRRKKVSHVMMHYNNNHLYSQQSVLLLQEAPYPLHWASETSSTSLKESLLLRRVTTPAAPRSMFPMAMAWLKLTSLSIDMMATSSASVAAMVVAKADSAI